MCGRSRAPPVARPQQRSARIGRALAPPGAPPRVRRPPGAPPQSHCRALQPHGRNRISPRAPTAIALPAPPAARPQSPRAARPGRLLRQLPFPAHAAAIASGHTIQPARQPHRRAPTARRELAVPPSRTAAHPPPPRQAHRRAHPASPLLPTRQLAGSKTRFFWQAMTGLQRLFRHQELLSQGGGIATWGFPGARQHRPRPSRRPRGAKGCKPVIACQKTGPILPRNPAGYDLHGSPPARPEKKSHPGWGVRGGFQYARRRRGNVRMHEVRREIEREEGSRRRRGSDPLGLSTSAGSLRGLRGPLPPG